MEKLAEDITKEIKEDAAENTTENENTRLHFGILIADVDDVSQVSIIDSIAEYTQKNDIHFTVYVGTHQTVSNEYTSFYETCINTIKNNSTLDGLIVLSGHISAQMGTEKFTKELKELCENLPVVSVSFAAPGIPSVMVDNVSGFFSSVDHLIKVHNKKQIAFVSGPEGHDEVEERLEGYKRALSENNIKFDKRYVLPGDFTEEGGKSAVEELVDKRKLSFDSISVCDDIAAIGVINELKRRGILVPTGISVVSFDDDRDSATFIPSLSTVQQNFFEIGRISVEKLHKMVTGIEVDELTKTNPVFLARQSCGCLENDILNLEYASKITLFEVGTLFNFVYNNFVEIFHNHVPPQEVQGWVSALIGKILEKNFCIDSFLRLFDEILINYNSYSEDYSPWQRALSALTTGVERYSEEIHDAYVVLATLIRATSLLHQICIRGERSKEIAMDHVRMTRRRLANMIASTFEIESLANQLRQSLPMLALDSAVVGLYNNTESNYFDTSKTIHTWVGFDDEKIINVNDIERNVVLSPNVRDLGELNFEKRRRALVFLPLLFENEEMGVLYLPFIRNIYADTYEILRINISSAVKGAAMLSKIHLLSVTDELTGLYNRRGFFRFSLSRLQFMSRNTDLKTVVMLMDMDGLKFINDTYGHKEGDLAISQLSGILRHTLRETDIIGRIGGDEFVIFSTVKKGDDAQDISRRIRKSLDDYNDKQLHPFKLSVSIGSVVLDDDTTEGLENAIKHADLVLYEEKNAKKSKGLSRK
ncbi:MAG: GGDEF domain-containing protein [Oscillospiraceae bacterium]|nr:GGDEF domain-containing protein [Oscillospiraceae bacterium]